MSTTIKTLQEFVVNTCLPFDTTQQALEYALSENMVVSSIPSSFHCESNECSFEITSSVYSNEPSQIEFVDVDGDHHLLDIKSIKADVLEIYECWDEDYTGSGNNETHLKLKAMLYLTVEK